MKIQITMKCPDALDMAAKEYANLQLDLPETSKILNNVYDNNSKYFAEDKCREFLSLASKWFEYDESVTLEIDTELKTCVVV